MPCEVIRSLQLLVLALAACSALGWGQGSSESSQHPQQHGRLSVPRVLLPSLRGLTVSYLLNVTSSSSCYSWSSSREDLISLKPIYDGYGCSCSAIVSTIRDSSAKNMAIVLVKDIHTEEVLRCDVILDKIHSLKLVTTTRELYVEEAPEKFEVRAYDDKENEFSSLEGIEFLWSVVSSHKDGDVIKLITFDDSPYEAPEEVKKLEAEGSRGNIALLEGSRTGSATVTVRLPQAEYFQVKPVEVTLKVIANLLISPPEASILLGDRLFFKIIQVREGRLIELSLPSPQYSLRIENEAIASLDTFTGLAEGQKYGTTDVVLHDSGAIEAEEAYPLKAILRVVEPYAIAISLYPASPSKPWSVQVGHHHSLRANIFDNENKPIIIGSETEILIEVKSDYFDVHSRTINGSIVNGIPIRPGVMKVTAKLVSVAGRGISKKISTTADLHIYDKIQIIPHEVVLPWYPTMKARNEFQLNATGGDGSYQWRSEGSSIAVSNRGLLTAVHLGEGKIFANMPGNPLINDTAKAWVLEPADMEIVWSDNEGAVGETLALHVALYGEKNSKHTPFNNCDKVAFDVSNVDGSIFENVEMKREPTVPLQGDACTVLFVKCLDVGRGRVMVQQRSLRRTVALTCFDPLRRIYPSSQHKSLLLTVGSSANVIYTGGLISNVDHLDIKKHVTSEKKDLLKLKVNEIRQNKNYHVFTVTCLDLGETDVALKLYKNTLDDILTEASLNVICATPHSVKLGVKNLISSQCPISATSQLNAISGFAELEISILDSEARVFHNASSLALSWSANPTNIIKQLPGSLLLEKLNEEFHPVPVLNHHYQILKLAESSSPDEIVEVTLEINNYINGVLKQAGVHKMHKFSSFIKAVLPIKLIKPLNIGLEQVFVYNHPGSLRKIKLQNGSGFFKIDISNDQFANVELNNGVLTIQPIDDGEFSVTVYDLCLDSPPVVISVEIVSIKSISAEIPPLIEEGQNVSCQVWAYSKLGSRMPIDDNSAPSLTYHILEGHIDIQHKPQIASNGAANFIVTGLEEGELRLQFSMGSATDIAISRVFSPLRIIPPEAVIAPGSRIRLRVSGGPPPPAIIKFYHVQGNSHNIAKINVAGDVDGLGQGSVKVECRAESDGVVLSRATGVVKVIQLEGVQIYAPVSTLLTGNTIPVYALGIPDSLGPDVLGSIVPNLQFHWYVTGDGAAVVSDILVKTNIDLNDTDRVSVRLTALRAGRITIHLLVTGKTGHFIGGDINYKASYDLSLIDPLKVLSPQNSLAPLLMALNSTFDLKTNYALENVNFKLDSIEGGAKNIIDVSQDGKVTSFNQLGHAIISISTVDSQIGMKQVIFLSVEVCSAQYVMADVDDKQISQYLENMSGLPKDLKLDFKLLQYDSLGRNIVGNIVKARGFTLQPHMLSFHALRDTVEVTLNDVGRSILRVSDKSTDKLRSDYIPIKVQTTILPEDIAATVGDVWCMRTIVGNGSWYGFEDRALYVNTESGFCQAKASLPDNTEVQFVHPKINTVSTVSITPMEKIWFLEYGHNPIVTNERPFTYSVILGSQDDYNKQKNNNLILGNSDCLENAEIIFYPFKCHISPVNEQKLNDMSVTSVFDSITGTYGCQIEWRPPKSEQYYTNETKHQINLWAQSKTVSTRQLKINLLHAAIAPKILKMSEALASLDVTGPQAVLDQVQVVPVSKSLFVKGSEKISDNLKRFYVKLLNKNLPMKESSLILHSALTKQSTKIQVVWDSGIEECSGSPLSNLVWGYMNHLVGTVLIIIITVVIIKYLSATPVPPKTYYPLMNRPVTPPQSFQSRSPLSTSPSSVTLNSSGDRSFNYSDLNTSMVYGDPSYLSSPERRRNKRSNLFL